jgi:hypothetical protein
MRIEMTTTAKTDEYGYVWDWERLEFYQQRLHRLLQEAWNEGIQMRVDWLSTTPSMGATIPVTTVQPLRPTSKEQVKPWFEDGDHVFDR